MALSPWRQVSEALDLPPIPDDLLRQAFQHGSYIREQGRDAILSNQRLEFLGDAVLDLIIAEELYRRHPDLPEGVLTKSKASLVRAGSLARVAAALDLGQYLLLGRGEEESGGRRKHSLLADAFEALIGAIYLGAGLEAARDFVLRHMPLEGAATEPGRRFDHKTALQELLQSHARQLPQYRTVTSEGPAHDLTFTVEVSFLGRPLGTGRGGSKRRAEQEAAHQALQNQETWLPEILKELHGHGGEQPDR